MCKAFLTNKFDFYLSKTLKLEVILYPNKNYF